MKTVLAQESRGTLPEDREKMVATIFYPDAAYGAQLVGAFQRAIAGLGEMEALDPRPWRLDVLQWPEMKAEASHDVACSRVIVVPADEAYAGSEFFRRWVEDWPAAAHGRRLLLMPRRGAGETPLRVRQFVQWLQAVCARKGMDFSEAEMAEALTSSVPDPAVMDSRRLVPPLTESQQREMLATYSPEWEKPVAPRFWGLNK
jgi:hypothetical protein